jgi:uncharacterized protein (DUF305 family)
MSRRSGKPSDHRRGGASQSPGPSRRRFLVVLTVLALAGCSAKPPPPVTPFNDVDVMFLQMGLEQIKEGDQVAAVAADRASDPAVRALATELRGQWRGESGTMQRWLLGWEQPLTPDPDASAHAGHGDLHSLRPEDLVALRETPPASFDRTAVSMLLSTLHNAVETTRMESAGGEYPPARALAGTMTETRTALVRRLLVLAAKPVV